MGNDKSIKQIATATNKFNLTPSEIANLSGRREVKNMWEYISDILIKAIDHDMKMFVESEVRGRLKVPKEKMLAVEFATGTVQVIDPPKVEPANVESQPAPEK